MSIHDKVSMIFCSCDAYSDMWQNFFFLLKKYWPEFDGEIILNTESQTFQYDGYSISEPLCCAKDTSWSERLSRSLDRAKNPYVLIMLEDFYLKAPVDHESFCSTLAYMQAHPDVAAITYLREFGAYKPVPSLPGFFLRRQFSRYKITAHITLYRRDYLRKLLRKTESAWEFEQSGTVRSWFMRGKFLGPETSDHPVFPYDAGSLILRGKYYSGIKHYFEYAENLVFSDCRGEIKEWEDESGGKLTRRLSILIRGFLSIFKQRA